MKDKYPYLHHNSKLFNYHKEFSLLCNLVNETKVPNSIIIDGMAGIGKSVFASHFINYVFSLDEEYKYNLENYEINTLNKSFKLVNQNTHPNLYPIFVEDGKNSISIDQIREMMKFANKSSFNNKYKIIYINKSDSLNKSSSNAILKILEEPNRNIIFLILQNSKNKNLKTILSRCIKFHLKLDFENVILTTNKILNDDIKNYVNEELLSHYSTPGMIVDMLNFAKAQNINLKEISLNEFITTIIEKKMYLKNSFLNDYFNCFLEKYLLKLAAKTKKKKYFNLYDNFVHKSYQTKLFNLDQETLYLDYKTNVLNG